MMRKIHYVIIYFFLMGFLSCAGVLTFISYSEAAKRKITFPKNWSNCVCKYFPESKHLGCANTADNVPRGLWFRTDTFKLFLYDKWVDHNPNIIPIAYKFGNDEPVPDLMGWDTEKKFAYSPYREFHDKFLFAILEGKRIAIKLADGPVHIFWKCQDSYKEGIKYFEMLKKSGQ